MRDAKHLTIRELSRRHRLSWHFIMDLVRDWSQRVGEHRRETPCRVLLVDETSLRRRHRYVTVISDGETGAVLGMVRHRNTAALSGFFVSQGHRWCRRVKVVISDGSEPYKTVIEDHLGHATHVLDRFHVARWFAAGLVEVRRSIQRREPGGVTPAFDPQVFRSRYLALKRVDRLTDAEHERLKAIFAVHAELARGWSMLQELYGLYQADDETEAMAALDRFADLYAEDPLPEFYKVVDTLLRWAPEIFAYHRTGRVSNGRLEGTNNKLSPKTNGLRVRQRRQLRRPRPTPLPRKRAMTIPTKRADPISLSGRIVFCRLPRENQMVVGYIDPMEFLRPTLGGAALGATKSPSGP